MKIPNLTKKNRLKPVKMSHLYVYNFKNNKNKRDIIDNRLQCKMFDAIDLTSPSQRPLTPIDEIETPTDGGACFTRNHIV